MRLTDPPTASPGTAAPATAPATTLAIALAAALVGPGTSPARADMAERLAGTAPLDERCWTLTFEEPFDTLDLHDEASGEGRWRTRYIWGRETIINEELQFYAEPDGTFSPFRVEDGVLTISAGPTPSALADAVAGQPYVSGALTTERSFGQRHGRFEARVRVPAGRGLWSALWLLPSFTSWPEGVAVLPEIDIMEHLGHERGTWHTTLHTNETGVLSSHGRDHTIDTDLTADFHLYSVVWTEETVRWYLDGEAVAEHPAPADFTRPVHFLLNLAVGGSWPGAPDASTRFPAEYAIDYVRAWRDSGRCD